MPPRSRGSQRFRWNRSWIVSGLIAFLTSPNITGICDRRESLICGPSLPRDTSLNTAKTGDQRGPSADRDHLSFETKSGSVEFFIGS